MMPQSLLVLKNEDEEVFEMVIYKQVEDDASGPYDVVNREFFSPAPISLTGNYWPRWLKIQLIFLNPLVSG